MHRVREVRRGSQRRPNGSLSHWSVGHTHRYDPLLAGCQHPDPQPADRRLQQHLPGGEGHLQRGVELPKVLSGDDAAILHFTGTEGNYIDIYINN